MESDTHDFDKNIEILKSSVKKSFSRIYASLKARELQTLRQLDAIRKQCQDNEDLRRNCVQNTQISYENESTLLDNIKRFGAIDLKKLNFDSSMFILEDYISPNDDHLYSYKCIEELTKEDDLAIQEAALKEITTTEDCVCFVSIQTKDISRKFRDADSPLPVCVSSESSINVSEDSSEVLSNVDDQRICDIEKCEQSEIEEVKKIEPTDEWLNSIKDQTETEPSQTTDVMEHSTITCPLDL